MTSATGVLPQLDRPATHDDVGRMLAVCISIATALLIAFTTGLMVGQIHAESMCRHRLEHRMAGGAA